MKIVVLPGDGIGPETMSVTVNILQAVSNQFDLQLDLQHDIAGHESLNKHGATVTEALLEKVKNADGLMLGPMATYDFKDEAKGEINPSKFFRKSLDLFANIRPARTYPGVKTITSAFDLVVVRENTEGFYADRNVESGNSEILVTPDVAISLRRITRECCERIARSAFELAMQRRRHLTLVHKHNVLKITDGIFLDACHRVAAEFPEVTVDDIIVDAMMAHVVRAPDRFDVIVTTNLFENYDPALLRRIQRHIKFRLPDASMRRELFAFHLPNPDRVQADYAVLAELSKGLSGGDIMNVCVNAIHAGSVDADPAKWLVTQFQV